MSYEPHIPPPVQKENDSYKRVVGLMHAYGARDDREAHEAARNLIGFARLALSVKSRKRQ
ncbi:MAG: hypothetical protein K0R10_138 [Alphaproteobacteria bacterium]|jgi:hypothetical protein|nr:hypothetical protein [Alphaproteobacteria bacterium]